MLAEQSQTRVLITGASGLLGSHVYRRFQAISNVLGTCFSTAGNHKSLVKVDLLDFPAFEDLVSSFKPEIIIHCAADLRCSDQDNTWRVNVDFTRHLANLASKGKIYVVFMSSAYVYDGLSPPFHEKHEAKPVNFYGRSKYFAELAITETCSEYLILRVPLLFGTKSLESVSLLIDSITNSESCFVDDYQVRYPTSTDDVAKAIEIAFMKWRGGNPIKGVYNFGSHSGVTKYQMCQILAKRLARSIDHIVPTKVLAPNRPQNCLLVTKKISDSGINFPLLTFSKWIEGLDLEK